MKTMNKRPAPKVHFSKFLPLLLVTGLLLQLQFCLPVRAVAAGAAVYKIGVLLHSDDRLPTLKGFQEEMARHEKEEGYSLVYDLKNAGADLSRLAGLAKEIITARPSVAIACGGVEADALKEASAGTGIPVVFLAVSAAVERGLAADMRHPGGNLTGIETNDAFLTGKRLWYITKLLPKARKVRIFHIPAISSSVEAVKVARESAASLGLTLTVVEVADANALKQAAAEITPANTDVVLVTPIAPLDAAKENILLPLSLKQKIPVMGFNDGSVDKGAFASYSGSRYEMGKQAVNFVHSILLGTPPGEIALETPEKIEFVLNRWMVHKLGLQLPKSAWRMADRVLEVKF